MSDMPRGWLTTRASVLPVQMQRKYQVRTPKLPDGMAFTLSEETLRAMQNTLPLHEAVPSAYAEHGSTTDILPTSYCAYMEESRHIITLSASDLCLGGMASVVHEEYLEGTFLVRRRGMG